jgi:hypothetical protein
VTDPPAPQERTIWNLQTPHGNLDIALRPAGFPDGYDQLRERADPRQVAEPPSKSGSLPLRT